RAADLLADLAGVPDRTGPVVAVGTGTRGRARRDAVPGRDHVAARLRTHRAGHGRAGVLDLVAAGAVVAAGRARAERDLRDGHRVLRRPLHLCAAVRVRAGVAGDPYTRPGGGVDDDTAGHPRRRGGWRARDAAGRAGRRTGPEPAESADAPVHAAAPA